MVVWQDNDKLGDVSQILVAYFAYFADRLAHIFHLWVANKAKRHPDTDVSGCLDSGNYLPSLRWKNLTISTMGMTRIARTIAMPYSARPTGVKPKAFARKGISRIAVVSRRLPTIASHRILFWVFRLKMDLR